MAESIIVILSVWMLGFIALSYIGEYKEENNIEENIKDDERQ
jgi:preprotein translocase subunit SecG